MTVTNLHLFKRPNGFWYILYTVDGRKRWKSTKCTDRSRALQKVSEFKDLVQRKPSPRSLRTFTQEFIKFARTTYAPGSVDIFSVALRNLLLVVGDLALTSVTPHHADLYKAYRNGSVRPTSVNVELRALRTVFNVALRWGLITTNPFSNVRLLRIPESRPLFFSLEEFNKLIGATTTQLQRDLFTFAISTGMRRGEILDLRWIDVNLERKTVDIHSSPTHRVKWGKMRTVPLGDVALSVLERRRMNPQGEFVFETNGQKLKGGSVTKVLKKAVRRAGLDDRLHFHSFRHSFATLLVRNHVPIYEIQKLLGHSDISMTQIYSHLVTSELHDAVNRIRIEG